MYLYKPVKEKKKEREKKRGGGVGGGVALLKGLKSLFGQLLFDTNTVHVTSTHCYNVSEN